jgi:histidine triad (HIT) family protein
MGCVFCEIVRGEGSAHRVFEDATTVAFLDTRPLFPGHILLVPKAHHGTFEELPRELLDSIFLAAQRLSRAVELALEADGTFLALNNKVSQSVPHVHIHIVPRKKKDGLKGFFWPRHKYTSEKDAATIASRIRDAVLSTGS